MPDKKPPDTTMPDKSPPQQGPPEETDASPAGRTDPVPPARRRRRRLVVTAAVVGLFLLGLPVFSTLQPGYYQRYPALRVRMQNWRRSSHAAMSCPACHVEPGAGNLILFAARSVPAFYSQLFTGPARTNLLRPPTRFACQKCHTRYRTVSPAGDLRIPHRAHVLILKINCTECHQKLVHWVNASGYNKPKMTFCLNKCHDGKKAKNQCTACHTQKQVPSSHRTANWLLVHGKRANTINCGKCHGWAPKLCQTCHRQRPSTHRGNWKKLHQFRARQRGKGCYFCHGGRKFCLRCHDTTGIPGAD